VYGGEKRGLVHNLTKFFKHDFEGIRNIILTKHLSIRKKGQKFSRGEARGQRGEGD